MHSSDRDAGLVRAVGPWALAASIVNIVVGAGIFAVPASLAACVGVRAPFVILACAVAVGAVALCFAEGGSRVPTSGGPYGVVAAAFGPFVGYVAGTLMWFSDLLGGGSVAAALGEVAVDPLPPALRLPCRVAIVVAVVGGTALVNVGGVARGAKLVSAVTSVKLLPLAVFLVVGATAVRRASFDVAAPSDAGGLGRAAILALFAFSGMEVSLSASGEVKDANRTIPRALGIAMASVTVLYVAVQVLAQGVLGADLATSSAPLADAMGRVSPRMRSLMLAGTALSMLGWLGSDILGTPRTLFAFARDGWLPSALGRVHPRTHAPHVAIVVYAVVVIALALSGTFTELAVLSTLAVAPLYAGGCVAAWTLARRGEARAGAPLGFRWLGVAAAVGTASMLALVALASRAEQAGLAGLLAVSAAAYGVLARRKRGGAAVQE